MIRKFLIAGIIMFIVGVTTNTICSIYLNSKQTDYIVKSRSLIRMNNLALNDLYDIIDTNHNEIQKLRNEIEAIKNGLKIQDVIYATITAYSPRTCETDDTPFTTAFMKKVRWDTVAISRDIMSKHGWSPGDKIYIETIGIRTVGDLMNKRFKNRIDVFFWNTEDAIQFGIKKNIVVARLKL